VGDPKTLKSKVPFRSFHNLLRGSKHIANDGNPMAGPIFANSVEHPLDLNPCYQREMKYVFKRAGIAWHGFCRGLVSNLNRIGADDSVIRRISPSQ
jgi:hypothetical protein